MFNVTDKEAIPYVVGLYDGEGSLGIYREKRRKNNAGNAYFYPRVSISNTDIATIQFVSRFLAANNINCVVTVVQAEKYNKPTLQLHVNQKYGIQSLCMLLKPFSITKATRIDIMLKFLCGNDIEKEQCYNEMKKLNKKGTKTIQ